MQKILYIIIFLMFAFVQGIEADSWDADNYKPYNTEVVLEKTNLPIFLLTRVTRRRIRQPSIRIIEWQCA